MRSETLDYIFEERGADLWIVLSGPFTNDQTPTFRERIVTLVEDGNRHLVFDLERVTIVDTQVVQLFLQLLNTVKGKSGTLKLVFKNEAATRAFMHYRSIIPIFPDATLLRQGGLFSLINRQRRLMLRKTGIRISRPVAIFLLLIVGGWIASLFFIIHLQNRHIKEQQGELQELSQWETRSRIEIDRLRSRLRPLDQLGIIQDTSATTP